MAKTKITFFTVAKTGRGEAVSMDVPGRICGGMDCNIRDIVDYARDEE